MGVAQPARRAYERIGVLALALATPKESACPEGLVNWVMG
jgi:hypothetical protein